MKNPLKYNKLHVDWYDTLDWSILADENFPSKISLERFFFKEKNAHAVVDGPERQSCWF